MYVFMQPPLLRLSSLPPSLPLSVRFIMCVLSWHFTVLSEPAGISRSAPLSNFPADCLLSSCLCLPLLSPSISALLYEMVCPNHLHFVAMTSIWFVRLPYFCRVYVCWTGLPVYMSDFYSPLSLCVSTDNERWSIHYFYWPLQTQAVSLASFGGEESIVIHQWLNMKKRKVWSRVELLSQLQLPKSKQPIADILCIHYIKSNQYSEFPSELYQTGSSSEVALDVVHWNLLR